MSANSIAAAPASDSESLDSSPTDITQSVDGLDDLTNQLNENAGLGSEAPDWIRNVKLQPKRRRDDHEFGEVAVSASLLLKLRIRLDHSKSLKDACQVLADFIAKEFKGTQVFVGIRQTKGNSLVLGTTSEDPFTDEQLREIANSQNEVTIERPIVGWPENADWLPALSHQPLASEKQPAITALMKPEKSDEIIGFVTFVGKMSPTDLVPLRLTKLLELVAPHFQSQREAEKTWLATGVQKIKSFFSKKRNWLIALGACCLLCLLPMPHRIESRAEVRPTVRRFAMAPFEGILRQSEVHTGDIVKSGQTIARMDEDEIRLQLSGIIAEKERVFKAKSSALASGETLEKQKAKLEYQRLQLQQELLEARIENLELNSPIDGVVLKNDFEDAEGAPLDKGQVVAEIAPLDQMRFQIFVSQWDIAHVNEGASVTIRFDGMVQPVAGTISRILPAATTYETESVFVVEVEVENLLGELRPGMRGYATIQAGYQSAGWILFRKPLRFVSRAFGY